MKTNINQPTQEFQIKKTYHGYPSKDKIDFKGSEQECKDTLSHWKDISRRNGADIVSEDEYQYTCDNYDSNGATVTFEIEGL